MTTEARSIERPLGFILDISAAIAWLTHSHHAVVICLGLLNWYCVLGHDIYLLFVQIDDVLLIIILHLLVIVIRASILGFAALSCVRFCVFSLVSCASLRLGQLLITLQLFVVFVD